MLREGVIQCCLNGSQSLDPSNNKKRKQKMSKKTETVKTAPVVEKPVVAEPQKHKWTRHIHNYYIYDQTQGFLMKDKSFGVTGERMTFDNLLTARTIQQFFTGTQILTDVQ